MIQVYRIPVPKERLRAMPKDERVLLLLLRYAANQLSMLQNLLNFATNRTPEAEVEQHATGVQTQMLVRLMVGALNEAWELVSTRFIQKPLAKDYLGRLDLAGQQAFNALKHQFGGSNLLNAVRNNYAFHYPRSDEVGAAQADGRDVCRRGQSYLPRRLGRALAEAFRRRDGRQGHCVGCRCPGRRRGVAAVFLEIPSGERQGGSNA